MGPTSKGMGSEMERKGKGEGEGKTLGFVPSPPEKYPSYTTVGHQLCKHQQKPM